MHMHKVIYLFRIVYDCITCWDWWIAESYLLYRFEPFEMIVGLFDATQTYS